MRERVLSEVQADKIEMRVVDSLQKIFMDKEPLTCPILRSISGLKGETVSFQIAYRYLDYYFSSQMRRQATKNPSVCIKVESELQDSIHVRKVLSVPSAYPTYPEYDAGYLTNKPGLFPDVLSEVGDSFQVIPFFYRSLWVDVEIPSNLKAGSYPVTLCFTTLEGDPLVSRTVMLEVIDCVLREQELIHTEWFYGDCLADYYHVPVWSESFLKIVDNFMKPMVKRGINTIFTPLFTYPLDTLIGAERTTIQSVGVVVDDGSYSFDFTNFERWIALAEKNGFTYFEMSHLFSQWGAKYAPKVMAVVDGEEKQLFGWETLADSGEFKAFLDVFLPALIGELEKLGIAEHTFFHISDEPNSGNIETYKAAKEMVDPYLKDFKVIDALSSIEFYQDGIIRNPVPTNEFIMDFLEDGFEEPWVYYCSGEFVDVSNRFFAMPSCRTRILGVQMYLYGIRGFLHWGYNYYNSQYSRRKLNPYVVTDADDAFPGGDSYVVYPGEDGKPEESLRLMVMNEALQDMRALQMLEDKKGKAFVHKLIEELADGTITFARYPMNADFILTLRERVNQLLK